MLLSYFNLLCMLFIFFVIHFLFFDYISEDKVIYTDFISTIKAAKTGHQIHLKSTILTGIQRKKDNLMKGILLLRKKQYQDTKLP